ncbi:MAG: hypothetical protein IT292_11675 [Deltaproteobacteria bacterium]|nr:hypothetical protein [Deltaproteobacteria bacterium]
MDEAMKMENLSKQRKLIADYPHIEQLLNSIPMINLILNEETQIVFSSATATQAAGKSDYEKVIGLRPGDALSCFHARASGRCGTTENCNLCGARKTVKHAIEFNEAANGECRINVSKNGRIVAQDFAVYA